MFKKAIIIFVMLISLVICGCERIVQNSADELKASVWQQNLENKTFVRLSFSECRCKIEINTNKTEAASQIKSVIEGICAVDSEQFVVSDAKTGQTFRFSYDLHGKKCDVKYNGVSLTLEKT